MGTPGDSDDDDNSVYLTMVVKGSSPPARESRTLVSSSSSEFYFLFTSRSPLSRGRQHLANKNTGDRNQRTSRPREGERETERCE